MGQLRIFRSTVLPKAGFVHGFPERTGGVSEKQRASLNLGTKWGDTQDNVDENHRRVAENAGYSVENFIGTKHVHGVDVWSVEETMPEPFEFDGMVSQKTGVVLGAYGADCCPILFADPIAGVCGAAHAGWRGTVGGIVVNMVKRMEELGSAPQNIRMAIGPSIGPCCFEVGDEVVARFTEVLGESEGLIVSGPKQSHVSLWVANQMLAEKAGVQKVHIDANPPCTHCNPERFFSYRREGTATGIHMGYVGLSGSSE